MAQGALSEEDKTIKLVEKLLDVFINDLRRNPNVRVSFYDGERAREWTLAILRRMQETGESIELALIHVAVQRAKET